MNGIEKITSRIASETEAEINAIKAEAEKKVEEITAEYAAKAQEHYDKLLAEGSAELEQQKIRTTRNAVLESKKELLSVKQEMVNAAYDKALSIIRSFPEDKYVAFLASQAATAAQDGAGELIFNASDREKFGEKTVTAANELLKAGGKQPGLVLSEQIRRISGGVIIRNGNVENNCSVEKIVEMLRGELDADIVGILFN